MHIKHIVLSVILCALSCEKVIASDSQCKQLADKATVQNPIYHYKTGTLSGYGQGNISVSCNNGVYDGRIRIQLPGKYMSASQQMSEAQARSTYLALESAYSRQEEQAGKS